MRLLGKILGGLFSLIILALAGASVWFWFYPVTVNNAVNKFTAEFPMRTPELMTGLGMIDNTPLDFHSGKLSDYTKAQDDKNKESLLKARAVMNRFNPEKLKGQEKLSWEISTWFLDDIIAQTEFDYSGYRVNQISGPIVDRPQFLTDSHVIKDEKSVKRYISRVNEFGRVLAETKARVEEETVRDFYAELPITVRVIGVYHDMGAFASDVGQLSRIVTLNDVDIEAGKDGNLTMNVTARTFRYLDEEEVAAQRKSAVAAKKGAKK